MNTKPMGASLPKSNAALGKDADVKSAGAKLTTSRAKDGDPQSHEVAASAHHDAAYAQQAAGNGTKAQLHQAQAAVHVEKANVGRRAKGFADQEGQAAERLSKKAGLSKHGSDPQDPRSAGELHSDAADAHDRASKAYAMAGDERSSAYHADKAFGHRDAAKGSSSASKSS